MSEHALSHVLIDPNRFNGEPYIRDTRFTVREILEMLARGRSTEEILEDHPRCDLFTFKPPPPLL